VQFVSHKLGRLIVPYALVAIFVSSALLSATHAIYAFVFIGQLAFYGLAAYGARLERRGRVSPARASTHA
jgi:hypothetical protein